MMEENDVSTSLPSIRNLVGEVKQDGVEVALLEAMREAGISASNGMRQFTLTIRNDGSADFLVRHEGTLVHEYYLCPTEPVGANDVHASGLAHHVYCQGRSEGAQAPPPLPG